MPHGTDDVIGRGGRAWARMRRATGVTLAVALLMSAPPVNAADWSVTTPDLTVTLSVPDVRFDGPETVQVPISVTYAKLGTKPILVSGSIQVNANQEGASNGISGHIWINSMWPTSGTQVGAFLSVYPSSIDSRRGPLFLSGEVLSYLGAGSNETRIPLALTPIQIFYNPTKLSKPRAKYVRDFEPRYEVTGLATAQTLTKGVVPADGTLTLQIKKPGRTQWISTVTTSVDSYGEYTFWLRPAAKFPKGTQLRVAARGCGWCTDALSAVGRI